MINKEKDLENLHSELTQKLLEKIRDPEVSASELNVARQFLKETVYQTVIPRNVRLSEAPSHGVPILIYDKFCAGSKSYSNFAKEFLKQENVMETAA